MITNERMSAIDGLRALGFEETGAYLSYRVFSLPGVQGVACVGEDGTVLTGLKASSAADSSGSSFALHVARASKLDVARASRLLDPDVAVQAFKDEVIKHSTFMSRLVTVPDGFAYGFSSGFGLATVLLLSLLEEYGFSAVPFVAIGAIVTGLMGGWYKVRETARESMYRRDDNRKYEKIKRIEAAVARIRPKEFDGVEGMIEEFVERWEKDMQKMQSTLNEIHIELKALNESTNPYAEFGELSRFRSFLSMESAVERIEEGFDEFAVLLEFEPSRISTAFNVEILDLERQLRDIEAMLAEITPGRSWTL